MRFCPYTHRSALVLFRKNVPFETVNVSLRSKPEWFLELNPLGKVPVIVLPNKEILFESEIVSDYLDETFDVENKLSANDPLQRAKDKRDVALFGKAISAYYTLRNATSDMENFNQLVKNFLEGFLLIETNLHKRNTHYFSGNEKPGMMDYMIWPWIERWAHVIVSVLPFKWYFKCIFGRLPLNHGAQYLLCTISFLQYKLTLSFDYI